MKETYAHFLISQTIRNYNKIAIDFSNTRQYLSADLVELKKYAKEGSRVLDLGCGNGRFSELFPEDSYDYIGVDVSDGLVGMAQKRYPEKEFLLVEPLKLPFVDNSFDIVYSLAVLHHIPSATLRKKFLMEVGRVLKPGGSVVITVWNLWRNQKTWPKIAKGCILSLAGLNQLDFGDIFYPFKRNGQETVERYIHCFTLNKLVGLVDSSGLEVKKFGLTKRGRRIVYENFFILATKKGDNSGAKRQAVDRDIFYHS